MMEEIEFGSLMFIIILAVIPRNSYANPVALSSVLSTTEISQIDGILNGKSSTNRSAIDALLDGTSPNITNSIADDVNRGADILKETMDWFKDNMLSSEFEKTVFELETQITKLPSELASQKVDILEGLYRSQDRIIIVRTLLEQAASTLKGYCYTIIESYECSDPSERLLRYSAKKFVDYANFVNSIIKDALEQSKKIQDEMSGVKAFLKDFNSKLRLQEDEIKEEQKDKADVQQKIDKLEKEKKELARLIKKQQTDGIIGTVAACILTAGLGCPIAVSVMVLVINNAKDNVNTATADLEERIKKHKQRLTYIASLSKDLADIKPTREASVQLTCYVDGVKKYLVTEVELLTKWKYSSEASIEDNKDLTIYDIKFNIKGIKGGLNDLMKACDNYLNQEIPTKLIRRPKS